MSIKKITIIFFFSLIFGILIFFIYSKFFKEIKTVEQEPQISEIEIYQSNIIKDINYTTKNADGDEYIISASEAEIDLLRLITKEFIDE